MQLTATTIARHRRLPRSDSATLAAEIAGEVVRRIRAEDSNGGNRNLESLRVGPEEMAAMLGIKRRTLTEWQRRRLIPFERIGPPRGRSIVLFEPAAVDRALRRWRVRSVGD